MASRFEGDIKTFSDNVEKLGFKCTSCKTNMSHFITLTFKKTAASAVVGSGKAAVKHKRKITAATGASDITLAPCLYKRR